MTATIPAPTDREAPPTDLDWARLSARLLPRAHRHSGHPELIVRAHPNPNLPDVTHWDPDAGELWIDPTRFAATQHPAHLMRHDPATNAPMEPVDLLLWGTLIHTAASLRPDPTVAAALTQIGPDSQEWVEPIVTARIHHHLITTEPALTAALTSAAAAHLPPHPSLLDRQQAIAVACAHMSLAHAGVRDIPKRTRTALRRALGADLDVLDALLAVAVSTTDTNLLARTIDTISHLATNLHGDLSTPSMDRDHPGGDDQDPDPGDSTGSQDPHDNPDTAMGEPEGAPDEVADPFTIDADTGWADDYDFITPNPDAVPATRSSREGFAPHITWQQPTPQMRADADRLGRRLAAAAFRGPETTLTGSITPPGRLHTTELVRLHAQRATGQNPTASPWRRRTRQDTTHPTLRFAISADASDSLHHVQHLTGHLTWLLAHATSHLDAHLAANAWNTTITPTVTTDTTPPALVPVAECRGGSTGLLASLTHLDQQLHLTSHTGVRVVTVITDSIDLPDRTAINRRLRALTDAGVHVWWLTTRPAPWVDPSVTCTLLDADPTTGHITGTTIDQIATSLTHLLATA